jgi:excisionase family DNA binding protein
MSAFCRAGNASASHEKEGRKMQTETETATWVTYEEAQRLTSLGRTTLWRICSSGAVKTARIGRAVRINRCSLEEYMEEAAEQASAE